jgi:SAM-dependent methyltransferase
LTASLPFTGERFTPEVKGAIWYEHWHRYSVMLPAARGRRVLDAACGEGYGSRLLADTASEVVGIDIDAATIGHAVARYAARSNLRYIQASCATLPLATGSIDLIVSFETIEHLDNQVAMLAEFRRVLAPTGALVISSPNKAVYSGESGGANAFHVRELTHDDLAAMLCAHFPQQSWYGQRVLSHSLIWNEQSSGARTAELVALADDRVREQSAPAPAMYFVVVCGAGDATLPTLADLSIFDDGAQSLYREYERALLAEKRLYWDEIDARKIADARLADLVDAAKKLEHVRRLALEREAELVRAHRARAEALAKATVELQEARNRLAFRESWRGWLRWPLALARQRLGKRSP